MQAKKMRPSDVAKLIIEITVALMLFFTFWRIGGLPLYLYVATQGALSEPMATAVAVVLVIASLGFAILATVKLMKIVHK
jgi:hypothetical protein